MSPKQMSFLTEGAESLSWSAHEIRHYEGKPFEADVPTTMSFYGITSSEQERQEAYKAALGSSRSADGIKTRPRTTGQRLRRPRSASPSRRFDISPAPHAHISDSSHTSASLSQPAGQAAHTTSPPAKKKQRPNALSFLDPDSPAVTRESITRVVAEAAVWRPRRGATPESAVESTEAPPPVVTTASSDDDKTLLLDDGGSDSDISSADTETSEGGESGDERTPKPDPTSGLELRMPGISSVAMALNGKLDYPGLPLNPHPQQQNRQQTVYPRTQSRGQPQTKAHLSAQQQKSRAYRYGTPEMPRGNANLPHLPPKELNPRAPTAGHVKHLPRAEKLPLTGYELLASQLSSHSSHIMKFRRGSVGAASTQSSQSAWSSGSGPGSSHGSTGSGGGGGGGDGSGSTGVQTPHFSIKPLYRKFEALNHRILLHLQDELSELEEQLHRLDTADTQTRRLQNSILPASRRAEVLTGGELQWHKTDVLGKIGYKLGQYNHVLSSFTETQHLPSPTLSDISDYRSYLDTQQPIAEIETRFLDAGEDLVTLAPPRHKRTRLSDEASSGLSSPSSATSSGSDARLSSSPSYLQSLNEEPMPVQSMDSMNSMSMNRSSLLFPSARNSHPPSPTLSSTSASSESSALSCNSSRATTAIFEKEELVGRDKMTAARTLSLESQYSVEAEESTASKRPKGKEEDEGPVDWSRATLASGGVLHLVIPMAVAVLVPIPAFALIPGVAGRMAVVLLVAITVFGAYAQAGTFCVADNEHPSSTSGRPSQSSRDLLCCAAVYGAVMAVVASVCA
ncbi:hypothetical protein SPBR_05653 [Sporothrix brasiliensis 5110]|uniref:DUF6594 domain-containing protein n=1 Tax=Sporothrix brasiliensis 5110 TaxID=1398154 RepID=A0A0C2J4E0_9PEZI|nr:uncharacterized protein SPBR_05653 [Sporothrix brasiliensis 5110]KIH93890.1 hypothetical protein SPBR_05653 [Sporothrix brasiliensis 5110]